MAMQDLNAYEHFIDFITSSPTLEQIAAYFLPADAQARVSELLYANSNRRLTDLENSELDDYQALGRIVRRTKILAATKLAEQTSQKTEATP